MDIRIDSTNLIGEITYHRTILPKMFVLINTTLYPSDTIGVTTCPFSKLGEYGLSESEIDKVDELYVGEQYESEDYGKGCIVVRIG